MEGTPLLRLQVSRAASLLHGKQVLDADVAILDEIDSGLDVDALRDVATAVNGLRKPNKAILLITHYQRLLDYINPDFVHIMVRDAAPATCSLCNSSSRHLLLCANPRYLWCMILHSYFPFGLCAHRRMARL